MNKQADKTARAPRSRHARAAIIAGGTTFLLVACNSLTGISDLNVVPGTVGPSGAGTGGTAGTSGVGGDAGIGGAGGDALMGGTGGGTSGGELGTPCGDSTQCKQGLSCAYGICRTTCASDAEAACAQTACLTDFGPGKGSGCRTASETCPNGAAVGDLLCGPDKILRMPCDATAQTGCRADQTCISGTCIGTQESGTLWGKCGKQGKSCANTNLTVCDVGAPGKHTDDCKIAAICMASVPGDAQTCVACGSSEKKCVVDGTTHQISGALCNKGQTGFDVDDCKGLTAQCNPSLGICQKIAIDLNEVTQADYKKFLTEQTGDTGKLPIGNPAVPRVCVDNDLKPDATCYATAKGHTSACPLGTPACEKHPQVCVDWCDAFAYCQTKGKKLCGKIGGGLNDNLPLSDFANPGASEWTNACTAGGIFVYATDIPAKDNYSPQGPLSIGQQCNGKDKGQAGDATGTRLTLPVDDVGLLDCKHLTTGYGARNLLGNVREWESSCDAAADTPGAKLVDRCRVRGGSFRTNDDDDGKTPLDANAMRCDYAETELRSSTYPDVGFRCCDL